PPLPYTTLFRSAANGSQLDAVTIEGLPAVNRILGRLPLGRPAVLRVRRGERQIDLSLVPRDKGAVVGGELACPRWDISVKCINKFESPEIYFHRKEG